MSERKVKSTDPPEPPRRRYHSPERAQRAGQTRARIISAARSLFLARGYAPTTMRAIADNAGVAEKTVYLAFANKPALLDAVIDAAIGGPDQSPRAADDHSLRSGTPDLILRAFCQEAAGVMERTARVLAIAEAAADIDPELAQLRKRGHAAMRARFDAIAAALSSHGALAHSVGEQDAAATIYAIVNDSVYLRLIDGCGWNTETYARWLEHVLTTALLKSRRPSH